ncbi:hypothetical protein, partial [Candidatus Hodgkinia cicadicola]|uniref:hypothetical protein n=1 Tax=Candidatus Hodgkinia cicadicola TaxID=573658 RepID=UPI0024157AA2
KKNIDFMTTLYDKITIKSHEFYIGNDLNLYHVVLIKPIPETTGSILKIPNKSLVLVIKQKQKWEKIYLTDRNRDLSIKYVDIEDNIIKLLFKYNTYWCILSFEFIINKFITLYRINKSLETNLSEINTKPILIDILNL